MFSSFKIYIDIKIFFLLIIIYLDDDVFKPQLEDNGEYKKEDLMKYELELFGFYLTNHPITEY
ncbi:MAG: hypothetical protein IKG14_05655, partial [Clostridia bacterium]|nr:hypothetical protein [Clostridia bacterium]